MHNLRRKDTFLVSLKRNEHVSLERYTTRWFLKGHKKHRISLCFTFYFSKYVAFIFASRGTSYHARAKPLIVSRRETMQAVKIKDKRYKKRLIVTHHPFALTGQQVKKTIVTFAPPGYLLLSFLKGDNLGISFLHKHACASYRLKYF